MEWVLDPSMALAWGLPDEGSKLADRFLSGLGEDTRLWVPALWWFEMANALTIAQRRQRLPEADALRLINLYRALTIFTDSSLGFDSIYRLQALALRHKLSAYDAAYLELAQRRKIGLATLDQSLSRAAQKSGVRAIRTK